MQTLPIFLIFFFFAAFFAQPRDAIGPLKLAPDSEVNKPKPLPFDNYVEQDGGLDINPNGEHHVVVVVVPQLPIVNNDNGAHVDNNEGRNNERDHLDLDLHPDYAAGGDDRAAYRPPAVPPADLQQINPNRDRAPAGMPTVVAGDNVEANVDVTGTATTTNNENRQDQPPSNAPSNTKPPTSSRAPTGGPTMLPSSTPPSHAPGGKPTVSPQDAAGIGPSGRAPTAIPTHPPGDLPRQDSGSQRLTNGADTLGASQLPGHPNGDDRDEVPSPTPTDSGGNRPANSPTSPAVTPPDSTYSASGPPNLPTGPTKPKPPIIDRPPRSEIGILRFEEAATVVTVGGPETDLNLLGDEGLDHVQEEQELEHHDPPQPSDNLTPSPKPKPIAKPFPQLPDPIVTQAVKPAVEALPELTNSAGEARTDNSVADSTVASVSTSSPWSYIHSTSNSVIGYSSYIVNILVIVVIVVGVGIYVYRFIRTELRRRAGEAGRIKAEVDAEVQAEYPTAEVAAVSSSSSHSIAEAYILPEDSKYVDDASASSSSSVSSSASSPAIISAISSVGVGSSSPNPNITILDEPERVYRKRRGRPSAPEVPMTPTPWEDGNLRKNLENNMWPVSFQDALINNMRKFTHRFFIGDDSGSMVTGDGHKTYIDKYTKKKTLLRCSRWDELVESMNFLAGIANDARAQSEFRLLNNGRPIVLGTGRVDDEANYHKFLKLLEETSPRGDTPLCHHIEEVIRKISPIADSLRASNQKFCVIIYSDGEASDDENRADGLMGTMRPLASLPARVILRLCTEDARIVNYWKQIQAENADMIIMDNFKNEAQKVERLNPWLTYTESIHRMREFGMPIDILDLLAVKSLTVSEIREFCSVIFNKDIGSIPDPTTNFSGFINAIKRMNVRVWGPLDRKEVEWIDTEEIKNPNSWWW